MTTSNVEAFRAGSGETKVLLIHGSGSAARSILRLGQMITERIPDAEAVAVSLAGYGSTAADQSRSLIDQHLDVLLAAVGRERWHVVGHSMGGFLALQLARRAPETVASLSLLEPMAFGVLDAGADQDALDVDRQVMRAFAAGREGGDGIRHFIEAWNQSRWEDLPEALRSHLEALEPLIHEEANAVSFDQTPLSAYQTLVAPMLLLAGSASPLPARRIAERLSNLDVADLHWIEGAGHMSVLRHPEWFTGPIVAHIGACGLAV